MVIIYLITLLPGAFYETAGHVGIVYIQMLALF